MDGAKYIFDTQRSLYGEPVVVGFGNSMFQVKRIERESANVIVRKNHYSKTTYSGSVLHFGVFNDGLLVGVLQFGAAMNPASQSSIVANTKQNGYLELNRMWIDDTQPRNTESKAISFCIKAIKKIMPSVGWIQSFADERCGRFGVVYQASNFLYCGEHTSVFWELDGEYFHNSLMTRNPSLTPKAAFIQSRKAEASPIELRQFRYIYFIKQKCKKDLLLTIQPFPKHAEQGSIEIRRNTNRRAWCGSTVPLQSIQQEELAI